MKYIKAFESYNKYITLKDIFKKLKTVQDLKDFVKKIQSSNTLKDLLLINSDMRNYISQEQAHYNNFYKDQNYSIIFDKIQNETEKLYNIFYNELTIDIYDFINNNRDKIYDIIKKTKGMTNVALDDNDLKDYILNNEKLYNWALKSNVNVDNYN